MNYSIFITTTEKDYNKIPYVLEGIKNNLTGYDEIIFCSPNPIPLDVDQVRDQDVLLVEIDRIKYRKFWVYQQFLKLFQNKTKNDYFLTIDCDTIINKPLPLFENDKPIWYKGWDQNNQPYYEYNFQMFGWERFVNHTFLADMNFFNKQIIEQMLYDCGGFTVRSFIEKSIRVINERCYPSEADIYGNYFTWKHKDLYQIKTLKTKCCGKSGLWSDNDLINHINQMKQTDLDTFSCHSWT